MPTKSQIKSFVRSFRLRQDSRYLHATQFGSFSIASSSWASLSGESSDYVFAADIAVNNLSSNDFAEVNFNRNSLNIVSNAGICPSGESLTGKIRIYAKSVPSAAISGQFIVFKEAF